MQPDDKQTKNAVLAANTIRAIEGKYFLRYLIVVLVALAALAVYWGVNRKMGG